MPAMECRCGTKLSWSAIPNPIEWKFIADTALDELDDYVATEELYSAMSSFLECPSCRRLWVFWRGFDSPPDEYERRTED